MTVRRGQSNSSLPLEVVPMSQDGTQTQPQRVLYPQDLESSLEQRDIQSTFKAAKAGTTHQIPTASARRKA